MAAVDWFAADVAPATATAPQSQPEPRRRRRARGRRVAPGILWISAFAVLLAGVVAVNVAVLRANVELDRLNQQELELQAENATLASQVSKARSSLRIEQTARRLGLVPAPATDTSYIELGRR
jgi:cell division protein FtsL